MGVGRLLSFWVSAYFQGRTVSFREGTLSPIIMESVKWVFFPTVDTFQIQHPQTQKCNDEENYLLEVQAIKQRLCVVPNYYQGAKEPSLVFWLAGYTYEHQHQLGQDFNINHLRCLGWHRDYLGLPATWLAYLAGRDAEDFGDISVTWLGNNGVPSWGSLVHLKREWSIYL